MLRQVVAGGFAYEPNQKGSQEEPRAVSEVVKPTVQDALESMVWQFAPRFARDGHRYLGAAGLSALEEAFAALGWDDPHPCDDAEMGCAEPGCAEWGTCGQPTPNGYEWRCFAHAQPWP